MKHVPPKHDRKEPRGWLSLFFAMGGTVSAISAFVCIAITIWSVSQYRSAAEYARIGIEIEAEITDRRFTTDSDGDDDYYLTFDFRVDGQQISRERGVSSRLYRSAPIGSQKMVRYLPRDPTRFETYVGEAHDKAVVLQWVAGIAGVASLIALWFVGGRANRAILTRKWGYPTIGRIEQIIETKNSGRPTGKGYLIWKTPDGVRGESMTHPIDKLNAIGVGAEINVYVRKGFTVWEGDVGPAKLDESRLPPVRR